MKKPIKPKKPTEPKKYLIENKYFYDYFTCCTLGELIEKIKEFAKDKSFSLNKVKLEHSHDGMEFYVPVTYQNENYEKELVKYNKKLIEYYEKLKKYEVKLEEYNKWKKQKEKEDMEREFETLKRKLNK